MMSWLPAEPQHQSASGSSDELQPVDQRQQLPGLLPDLLRAAQVARVVIGDLRLDPPVRLSSAGISARNSLMSRTFAPEGLRARRPLGVPGEQRAVFLQHRAAGGAVGDDHVDVVPFENGDVVPGLPLHEVHPPVAASRHPAALDVLRGDHRASVARQNAQRGGALVGEEQALGAAEEEAHAVARLRR